MQQDVDYIKHLKNVNARFYDDKLITSSHVAVYNSLFQFWNKSFFDTYLSINRDSVMKQAKIGSVNTYLKCLKELEIQGYLKYNPSHNPLIGSIVNLFRFDTTLDIVVIKSDTSSATTPDKPVIPYINSNTLKQETIKLINENASLIDLNLKDWIKNHKDIKVDYQVFEKAWALYGKRGTKADSKIQWAKIKESDYDFILDNIPKYISSVSEIKYLKHFERYLSKRLWEDSVVVTNVAEENPKQLWVKVRLSNTIQDFIKSSYEQAVRENKLNCDNPEIIKEYYK